MKIEDSEIKSCLETLKKLQEKHNWFLIHETRSIGNVIEALESILHFPSKERE